MWAPRSLKLCSLDAKQQYNQSINQRYYRSGWLTDYGVENQHTIPSTFAENKIRKTWTDSFSYCTSPYLEGCLLSFAFQLYLILDLGNMTTIPCNIFAILLCMFWNQNEILLSMHFGARRNYNFFKRVYKHKWSWENFMKWQFWRQLSWLSTASTENRLIFLDKRKTTQVIRDFPSNA